MSGNAVPPVSNPSNTSPITNATASPTANAQTSVQPASDADRSRIADRIAIARAEGHGLGLREHWEDEEEEDFVAVDHEDATDFSYYFRRQPHDTRSKLDELHPFVQLLSLSNVDDCVTVEGAFPEPERCSREKVGIAVLRNYSSLVANILSCHSLFRTSSSFVSMTRRPTALFLLKLLLPCQQHLQLSSQI